MAHVQMAGRGGRRGVDGVDGLAVTGVVETVNLGLFPLGSPLGFEAFDPCAVGQRSEVRCDGFLFISHSR